MFQSAEKPRIQDILRAGESLELSINEIPSNSIRQSRENTERPPLSLKRPKKVKFDTNVVTYEYVQVYDSIESLLERIEKGETFPKSKDEDSVVLSKLNYRYANCVESDDEYEDFVQEDYDIDEDYYSDCDLYDDEDEVDDAVLVPSMESNRKARDNNDHVLSVFNPIENLDQWRALKSKGSTPLNFIEQKENAAEPENQNQESVFDTMISSSEKCQRKSKDEDSVALSTSNYRYANCVESDDEYEDFVQEDYDFDEDYYSDCDLYVDEDEVDDAVLVPSMESNRKARDNNGYVLSVFNPIENLDQWKALKSKGSARKQLNFIGQKENAAELENQDQETVVETSLSSWMISSSDKCQRNNQRVACYYNTNEVLC